MALGAPDIVNDLIGQEQAAPESSIIENSLQIFEDPRPRPSSRPETYFYQAAGYSLYLAREKEANRQLREQHLEPATHA